MNATHLHFDPFHGLSGDMTLGALVDLGVAVEAIEAGLRGLPIGPFRLTAERVKRQGLMGTKVHVEVEEEHHVHRHLRHINEFVDAAGLPPRAAARARDAYRRLAEAEATVHGSTPEKIHFHEVGAKDAIIDVAGSMLGIELLGATTFSCGPVTVGFGNITCAHGRMPVPAPATAELLRGAPQTPGENEGEMVTPTGAAILAALMADAGGRGFRVGSAAPLRTEKVGYGAGTRVYERSTNYLRLMLCQPLEGEGPDAAGIPRETVVLLECEIDDMSPELAGGLMERLLGLGALDVQFQPVQMKKNRPGLGVRVIATAGSEEALAGAILRETSSFGLRRAPVERWALARRIERVETPAGPVEVKLGLIDGRVVKASPEFESCAAVARAKNLPLADVYALARAAAAPLIDGK
jgi:uncharacterized protein (TIGR00299 family) protein